MDIIDFRYRPPYGSYRETIMYRDLERAKRCSEAFGMNQSPAVAARDMEASLTEMDRAGIGMAVLAGDALLNKAFETAAEAFSMIGEAADIAARYAAVAKALQILANKAGIYGMIGGQCADICAEELPSDQVTKELLWYIHKNKTAALIEAALMIGAVLAGAPDEAVKKLEQAAENIGIAFQIQDDILDVTSSLEVLGKPVGSDEKNHKVTYVRLNGLEQSKKDVEALSEEALTILSSFDRRNEFLEDLVRALITREK